MTARYRIFLLFVLCYYIRPTVGAQIETFSELDQRMVSRGYYFYPSVLRIINQGDDPAFYSLIRDVDLVVAYRMHFGAKDSTFSGLTESVSELSFVEYLDVNNRDYKILVYGREDPNETILLIGEKDRGLALDILGPVNVLALTQLTQTLSADNSDYLDVFSLIGYQRDDDRETEAPDTAKIQNQE